MNFGAAVALYYQSRTGCPIHGNTQLAAADNDSTFRIDENEFKRISNAVKNSNELVNEELFKYTTNHLHSGIDNVLGKIKPGSPLFDKMVEMKYNTARFAAFKTAHQVHDIRQLNHSDDDYDEKLNAINAKYNANWLNTEHIHTVRSARAVKKWVKFQEDKDLFPYLEYRPSTAAEPRNEHRKLYGVVKEVDDPFWDTWMPPNDWGCKCRVRQVSNPNSFVEPPQDIKKPPAVMRQNPGKTGKAFTDGHPMIKQVSKTTKLKIEEEFNTLHVKLMRILIYNSVKSKIGKVVKVKDMDILISGRGVRKAISQTINDDFLWNKKLFLLNNLEQILKSSKFIREELPKNSDKRRNLKATLIYEYEQFHLIIWKTSDSFIFHSIKQKNSQN